jgi:Fe-S oxidoreductase/FAD/FMN-containing dehydrogenase
MNKVLEVDADRRVAIVQPGVVQDDLNAAVGGYGLMFGADTSTSNRATLGGMIGNNSSGTHSVKFGTTRDHVISLEVVLSDGSKAHLGAAAADAALAPDGVASVRCKEIQRGLPRLVAEHGAGIDQHFPRFTRHSGGYWLRALSTPAGEVDLAKLLVGSEGTLALTTAAELALVSRPTSQAMLVGLFESTAAAVAATTEALALEAAAVELMDRTILDLARQRLEYADITEMLTGDPGALLFVTFFGDTENEASASVDALEDAWRRNDHGYARIRAVAPRDRAAVLRARKAGLGLLMAASHRTRRPLAFIEDTAVPPERLAEYVAALQKVLDRYDMRAGFYGHCSVGCLHVRPYVDVTQAGEVTAMKAVAEEVVELALQYGGVNSSEHGDGLVRSEFNRRVFGERLYGVMVDLKTMFDPAGILNPGKIVGARPMDEQLRDLQLRPGAALPRAHYRFQHGESLWGAADRCMNIGACRKTDRGVMCPSYVATREEEHSTRGRANALVKALASPDPRAALGDRRLFEILDLCLECKACKRECPLSVDMATMKSEFLSQYYETNRRPIRERVFSNVRRLNRAGSAVAPLANALASNRVLRAAGERWLGISARRPLPRFEHTTLGRWHGSRTPVPVDEAQGDVVVLADSLTAFTETAVGRAAIELLESAGWRVRLETSLCCGRAAISKGQLRDASKMARALVDRLAPHVARGVPVVGWEPSCVLTLKDEYPLLLPDDPAATSLGEHVDLMSTLLVEAIDTDRLRLDAASAVSNRRILFHPHCHERAIVGSAASRTLLERIPGAEVVELDAGCCGMAGSFGYEREHYELSMKIGGNRLFPAIEREPADTIVAASGASCRQQIVHGTGKRAVHPIELLRASLAVRP